VMYSQDCWSRANPSLTKASQCFSHLYGTHTGENLSLLIYYFIHSQCPFPPLLLVWTWWLFDRDTHIHTSAENGMVDHSN
jgi:hypothetical protein